MEKIVEEFLEKMTDKIAEKVADILTKRGITNIPNITPPVDLTPTQPYDPFRDMVLMYGCTPNTYTTTGIEDVINGDNTMQDITAK